MNCKKFAPTFRILFLCYIFAIGLIIMLTGLLHYVYNSPNSFEIQGFQTNPELAVFLVAMVLVVCGFTTCIYSFFGIIQRKKIHDMLSKRSFFFSIWFLILSCLTFFMTGIMGFITSIFCFINMCGFFVIMILNKVNKKKDVLVEKQDIE